MLTATCLTVIVGSIVGLVAAALCNSGNPFGWEKNDEA